MIENNIQSMIVPLSLTIHSRRSTMQFSWKPGLTTRSYSETGATAIGLVSSLVKQAQHDRNW
ncbi:MAG: hypothetical protein JO261_12270 [Alphaproteobacteria bacterium]|nr:hypothetical protein [Alphaproteobacteria bacterium]MBV9694464.1 hypothetical protein [Alphaproteobacteria bacterium]